MSARIIAQVLAVVATLLACWIVPAGGMQLLLPVLERSGPKVVNFNGRPLTTGLGTVWLLWAAGTALAASLASVVVTALGPAIGPLAQAFGASFAPVHAFVMVLLAVAAFGFGIVDDMFGDSSSKGFRGHLGALRRGELTTGGLKLLGIGSVAALAAASLLVETEQWRLGDTSPAWSVLAAWVLMTLVIALSANLVNLTDLRPGRALKTYALLVVVGVFTAQLTSGALQAALVPDGWLEPIGATLATCLLVLGPLFAVWRFDLGERGMLGDGGANAAGAVAGYVLAGAVPLWGLAVAAAILLALNVASERVSFSALIEGNSALRWLDRAGRTTRTGMDGTGKVPAGTDDVCSTENRKDGAV